LAKEINSQDAGGNFHVMEERGQREEGERERDEYVLALANDSASSLEPASKRSEQSFL